MKPQFHTEHRNNLLSGLLLAIPVSLILWLGVFELVTKVI